MVRSFRAAVRAFLPAALLIVAPVIHAAYTDDFDALRAELAARSEALAGSTDKTEQKQKKAVDKAIAAIDKASDSLATDIKTAGKVATTLQKAFPEEFIDTALRSAPAGLLATSLYELTYDTFENLADDIYAALTAVQAAVDGMPEGDKKNGAQHALESAFNLYEDAYAADSFKDAAKLLGMALKNILKAAKAAGSGGPGPGGEALTATIQIGAAAPITLTAEVSGGEWVQNTGVLDIGGSKASPSSSLTVSLCQGFNGQTGQYQLGNDCGGYIDFSTPAAYLITSGTLNVTTFDAGSHSASGTFSYTATDGITTVTVTNGSFNITNLAVTN